MAFMQLPAFMPNIYSIEEFIIELSGINSISRTQLLFELYEASESHFTGSESTYDSFLTWGSTLLADFNEIDLNLVDHDALFEYMVASERIKNWGKSPQGSNLIEQNIHFWKKLKPIYRRFTSSLLNNEKGSIGMSYRKAVENTAVYIDNNSNKQFQFIGFNALNKAEEELFTQFLKKGIAKIWWDIDSYFLEDDIHEAGYFIRKLQKKWSGLSGLAIPNRTSNYLSKESIQITGVPKTTAQAKFCGNLLKEIFDRDPETSVALILADESLLEPILQSLPNNINKINITMGLRLKATHLFDFYNTLFQLYKHPIKRGWHYKTLIKLLTNPHIHALSTVNAQEHIAAYIKKIREKNMLFIAKDDVTTYFSKHGVFAIDPFHFYQKEPGAFISLLVEINHHQKRYFQKTSNFIALQQLTAFDGIFNQLTLLLSQKMYLHTIEALSHTFTELVGNEQMAFKGDPFEGLQIMGLLESRNLDFDCVIVTSVNEGILPAGKQNSYIPFEMKREFGLPTHKEKDAVYAYHFYRLLQRSKKVFLIYNTEPDVLLGNERSRFVSQLLSDPNIQEKVRHQTAAPELHIAPKKPRHVTKSIVLQQQLQLLCNNGLSPSALSQYVKNPYEFYKSTVLRIPEAETVEERIAHNTFGTIIHDILEDVYRPLVGLKLSKELLMARREDLQRLTLKNFEKFFLPKDVQKGRNAITFEVIKKYVSNFLEKDMVRCSDNEITIIAVEKTVKVPFTITQQPYPIFLKGKLDRLETVNGLPHILDYKTGQVYPYELKLDSLNEITTSEKQAKAFQLLCYAYMIHSTFDQEVNLLASIVPIKKLGAGFIPLVLKTEDGQKSEQITPEVLSLFKLELSSLLREIIDAKEPFTDLTL